MFAVYWMVVSHTTANLGRTCLLLLAALLLLGAAAPDESKTLSVYAYGARGDGRHNDTGAIQRTIDAAAKSGPGTTVWLPANGTFMFGGG